jgi:methionyl-tRNA formyltransferase
MVKILYMGNNLVALEVLKWLKGRHENIAGLVVHPPEKSKYGEEIISASGLSPEAIFRGTEINQAKFLDIIQEVKPDIILSIFFNYILQRELIEIPRLGCVNLHPAYLPYGRGQYPNVWSIVEETPAGVTLHYILDEGIDTGDIIAQKAVPVDFTDTGESLYHKLESACIELFKENWEDIKHGTNKRIAQPAGGTYHTTRDVRQINEISLEKKYEARQLLNIVRARTFPPYEGAYVILDDGRKVYVRISLEKTQE